MAKKLEGRGEKKVNQKEFEHLYEKHAQNLRKYLRGRIREEDVEDVLQEVFYLAWKKRELLRECENPAGWLFNATKFKILENRRGCVDFEICLEEKEWERFGGKEDWMNTQSLTEWRVLFEQYLDAREHRIVKAICMEGLSLAETARREKMPKESLRRHFQKALEKLRKNMAQHGIQ